MTAKALIEIHDTIRVWVEMRPPKKGELFWTVPIGLSVEHALDAVIAGRDFPGRVEWERGVAGFGVVMDCEEADLALMIDEGLENITVHVEHARSAPTLGNLQPHIKVL
jgi:hypothetical protein